MRLELLHFLDFFGKMVLNSQSRELIFNVLKFMNAREGITIPLNCIIDRVVKATGVSRYIVLSIKEEGPAVEIGEQLGFSTPGKKRDKKSTHSIIDADVDIFLRRHIHNFYKREKKQPTLDHLMVTIKEDGIPFNGSKSSLSYYVIILFEKFKSRIKIKPIRHWQKDHVLNGRSYYDL